MTGKVVKFYTAKNPDHVLEKSIGEFKDVIVIGITADDYVDLRANTSIDKVELLWHLESIKNKLINGHYD